MGSKEGPDAVAVPLSYSQPITSSSTTTTTTTTRKSLCYCCLLVATTIWLCLCAPTAVSMKIPSVVKQNARGFLRRQEQRQQKQQEQQQQQNDRSWTTRLRSSTSEELDRISSSSESESSNTDDNGNGNGNGNDNDNGNGNGNDNDNEKHQDDNTETSTTTNESSSSNDNDNDNNKNKNDNSDDVVIALLERHRASATTTTTTTSSDSLSSLAVNNNNDSSGSSTSAARWKRRKQIAMGLVASIAITVGAAKIGILPGPPLEAATNSIAGSSSSITYGTYTNAMIARDAAMTGLTSILAVAMNRAISFGYESGAYDSKTGRKLTHILSAPLFIATWPFFSNASGARFFAGLVCLTNLIRLYLAGKGDAAESSLADTISRTGDRSEVLGGPFIYVCLFQLFILAFWRDSFPGVVAMTTMAAGDGMADIIGRRFGKNGYKWPFSDGQKSLVGTAAFCASAFALTTAACYWLLLTGCLALPSTLAFADVALRIGAISCICALVEILPIGDDNYTVPGSAALLAALW
eukprot:CAMPEP_0168239080 /NCGR_PEP_ID=MMETSP0140_2-20121125/21292_1 /TAXON_ID=44445 /ORGANISM="Pseudo-nitzschia australis, Strain 10249 10 AB" /LENGTH=522 /DNA_ID=CAMNT_0008173283 /DNA_START=260 /DNA_END=1825 /DNA_ORIENTATION=+